MLIFWFNFQKLNFIKTFFTVVVQKCTDNFLVVVKSISTSIEVCWYRNLSKFCCCLLSKTTTVMPIWSTSILFMTTTSTMIRVTQTLKRWLDMTDRQTDGHTHIATPRWSRIYALCWVSYLSCDLLPGLKRVKNKKQ